MDRKSNGKKKEGATSTAKPTLDPGDIICPKCKGTGWIVGEKDWDYRCDRCWGAGKLDWIERIMGKPSPYHTLKADWTLEEQEDLCGLYDSDLGQKIIDAMSEEIAKEIDEEIIGKMINISVTKSKLR